MQTSFMMGHVLSASCNKRKGRLVFGFVHQRVLSNPRHPIAEFLADYFDIMLSCAAAHGFEPTRSHFIFHHPILDELAGLNVLQDRFHALLPLLDARGGCQLRILTVIGIPTIV